MQPLFQRRPINSKHLLAKLSAQNDLSAKSYAQSLNVLLCFFSFFFYSNVRHTTISCAQKSSKSLGKGNVENPFAIISPKIQLVWWRCLREMRRIRLVWTEDLSSIILQFGWLPTNPKVFAVCSCHDVRSQFRLFCLYIHWHFISIFPHGAHRQ